MAHERDQGRWVRRWFAGACLAAVVGLSGCCVRAPEVTHVVVCHLKEPGNQDHRYELIRESLELAGIPGVKRVAAGKPLAGSTRPVVDSSYDVLIVMTFKNERALAAYQESPRHKRAVEEVLKPLVDRYVIYDAATRSAGR